MTEGLIIDCFCGGGGATEGIEQALGRAVDIGVNHDKEAIRLHMVNHPETLHLTEDIFEVDLEKYVAGRHVALMWASPDCTQFSKAKGSKPREHGIRILPWAVHKHASKIFPDVIIMENVEEIQSWGELDENGYPIKEKEGLEYERFMKAMSDLGYEYQTWELVAADYGAPTTRKRWYAVFRRDGERIVRPMETHSETGDLFREKWLECGDYIDWSDLGKSIFDRKKPLAENTQARIARGLKKFVIDSPHPYIVDEDKAGYLIQYHSETTKTGVRGQELDKPIKTLDTQNRYGLVTAFLTKFYKSGTGQSCSKPLATITTSPGHFGLVSAFLTRYYGGESTHAVSLDKPIGTFTTRERYAIVSAFMMKYYGTGDNTTPCDKPVPTLTTKERFGLVTCGIDSETYAISDIKMRMLEPEEMKLMQGFPKSYIIDHDIDGRQISRKEQVAKIGNSVVPAMAKAIVQANCAYLAA